MDDPLAKRKELLRRLLGELPATGSSEDADEQTRAVLVPVVRRAVELEQTSPSIPPDPTTCPNCGVPCDFKRTPYCGDSCREVAAFVRQFRTSLENGVIFERDRQVGMGQALWNAQGGGFPRRQRMVKPKEVAKAIEKGGGVCSVCGAPATEVDHWGSACNRTSNLVPVCSLHNRARGFGDPNFDLGEEVERFYDDVAMRLLAPIAIRCCDDAEAWDWRAYLNERLL